MATKLVPRYSVAVRLISPYRARREEDPRAGSPGMHCLRKLAGLRVGCAGRGGCSGLSTPCGWIAGGRGPATKSSRTSARDFCRSQEPAVSHGTTLEYEERSCGRICFSESECRAEFGLARFVYGLAVAKDFSLCPGVTDSV